MKRIIQFSLVIFIFFGCQKSEIDKTLPPALISSHDEMLLSRQLQLTRKTNNWFELYLGYKEKNSHLFS
jgi:hypothetical protein